VLTCAESVAEYELIEPVVGVVFMKEQAVELEV
jgi:hypothetical protein